MLSVDVRLALRNVLRHRRRSAVAILAIGAGVIAILLSGGFIEWIFREMREDAIANQYGHIQIVKPGYLDNGQSDSHAYVLPAAPPVLPAGAAGDAIRSISPRLAFFGLASHGDTTISFMGEGVDPVHDPSFKNVNVISGRKLGTEDQKGILMGHGLAANLGVKAGDTIVLLVTTGDGGVSAVEGPVVGLTSTAIKEIDDAVLRIPIDMARKLMRVNGAHVWVVSLSRTEDTATIAAKLAADKAFAGYEIVPWNRLADFYNKTVELFSRQIGFVKAIIAAIIVLSISNTMIMAVMERTVEVGTAMALGIRRSRILGQFILEGTMLGIIGGCLGGAAGYALSLLISAIGIPMPPAPGMNEGFDAAIIVSPPMVLEAVLLSAFTTVLASVYPAFRASKLEIVDALRHGR